MIKILQIAHRSAKIILGVFLFVCLPSSVFATETYDYAEEALQSIRIVSMISLSTDFAQESEDMAIASIVMPSEIDNKLILAKRGLEPFLNSNDTAIKQSATILISYLDSIKNSTQKYSLKIEKMQNNPVQALDANGTELRELYEIQEQMKADWNRYALSAGTVIALALIDSNHAKENGYTFIRIDSNELDQLKCKVNAPNRPKLGARFSLPYNVLMEFLNRKKMQLTVRGASFSKSGCQ